VQLYNRTNNLDGTNTTTMCNTPAEYDYDFSKQWNYTFTECDWPTIDEIATKRQSSVFIQTQRRETQLVKEPALQHYSCEGTQQTCNGPDERVEWLQGEGYGVCACVTEKFKLVVAVENVSLSIQHTFYTTFKDYGQPKTVLRLKGTTKILKTWQPSDSVNAYLWELLEWASVDLDQPLNKGLNEKIFPQWAYNTTGIQGPTNLRSDLYPTARVSGVKLNVNMNYFNHGQEAKAGYKNDETNEGSFDMLAEDPNDTGPPPVCIMELDPQLTWTSLGPSATQHTDKFGSNINYRQGVLVNLRVLGNVGTWNVFLLIASLINGLVLLNAANVVVNIIACYLMGLKSPFFKSAVIEDVNFREQYARYAAHLVSAVSIFDQMDTDGTEKLDRRELYEKVIQVVDQHMEGRTDRKGKKVPCTQADKDNISMALVDFMMKQSDMDQEQPDAAPQPKSRTGWFGRVFGGASKVADEETPDAVLKKQEEDIDAARELNNPEWVAAFNGKQCNLDTLEGYIKRKQKNGLMGVAKVPPPNIVPKQTRRTQSLTAPREQTALRLPTLVPRAGEAEAEKPEAYIEYKG